MFHRKKNYQMNTEQANTALQNVFAACNVSPNTVPFDKILLQQAAHTKTFDTILRVIAITILFTLCLPFLFAGFKQPINASPIILKEQYTKNDKLYLKLDFGNHNIKYEEAYLISPSGTIYEIVSFDVQSQTLCFPDIVPDCSIYIPYDENQILHLQLDPQ